jgi:hypothetical protein
MTRYDHAILAYAALLAKAEADTEEKRLFWADRAWLHHAELGVGPQTITAEQTLSDALTINPRIDVTHPDIQRELRELVEPERWRAAIRRMTVGSEVAIYRGVYRRRFGRITAINTGAGSQSVDVKLHDGGEVPFNVTDLLPPREIGA